jgi:hypothetical protein
LGRDPSLTYSSTKTHIELFREDDLPTREEAFRLTPMSPRVPQMNGHAFSHVYGAVIKNPESERHWYLAYLANTLKQRGWLL